MKSAFGSVGGAAFQSYATGTFAWAGLESEQAVHAPTIPAMK